MSHLCMFCIKLTNVYLYKKYELQCLNNHIKTYVLLNVLVLYTVILSPIRKISHRPKYFNDGTIKPSTFIQISLVL